jgi:hypothetical protein
LEKNLISVGQLDDEGIPLTSMVVSGRSALEPGYKTSTLYMTTNIRDTVVVADASANSKLWHLRLGHISEKGMKVLLSKGKLPELKSTESNLCEGCILGKHKRLSFTTVGRTPKPEKLEMVHIDLWGPSLVESLGGSRYYVTLSMTQVERYLSIS